MVLGRVGSDAAKPTVVVYGHYDVMPAGDRAAWRTDPWALTGINGYLYGRGATDDKGPILATVFAVKELLEEGKLLEHLNVVFLYEGEEESSSAGFRQIVQVLTDCCTGVVISPPSTLLAAHSSTRFPLTPLLVVSR